MLDRLATGDEVVVLVEERRVGSEKGVVGLHPESVWMEDVGDHGIGIGAVIESSFMRSVVGTHRVGDGLDERLVAWIEDVVVMLLVLRLLRVGRKEE